MVAVEALMFDMVPTCTEQICSMRRLKLITDDCTDDSGARVFNVSNEVMLLR